MTFDLLTFNIQKQYDFDRIMKRSNICISKTILPRELKLILFYLVFNEYVDA